MYRIVLACKGVPTHAGAAGARDISNEFAYRPWHENVTCVWDGSQLILHAENDFDSNGLALVGEFSDAILKPHVSDVLVCDSRKNALLRVGNKNWLDAEFKDMLREHNVALALTEPSPVGEKLFGS